MTLCILLSLCGCFGKSTGEGAVTHDKDEAVSIDDIDINIPYSVRDSFNPFAAQTEMNRAITSLMYDGLFEVDNTFKANPLMVSSYICTQDAIRVTIAPSAVFSDKSAVTAEDVAYSFEQAKKCERYKNSLSCFKEAQVNAADTVSFVYSRAAADAQNLLTFPIVKSGTNNPSSMEKLDVPTGGGRYVLTLDENNNPYLACHRERLGGYQPVYNNIGLVSIADSSTAASSFSLDHISFITDSFSTGSYTQIIGTPKPITMTNFVYLVFNKNNAILKESKLRYAISCAADRQELADFCFISYAKPTCTPFHSDYYLLKGLNADTPYDTSKAAETLDSLGYSKINDSGKFRYGGEQSGVLVFNLAVCQDNEFKLSAAEKIKEQLAKVNIKINIYKYTESDFFKIVSTGQYDMYIGECKLKNNLDISEFFDASSSISSGINTYCESAKAWESYKKSEAGIEDFIKTFSEELPFLPLLYRNGRVTSNSSISQPCETIVTDYYYNADKWTIQTDDQ